MKKVILIVIDGLGDESIPVLGNKTPLEAAKTPNLDFLSQNGICGLVEPNVTKAIPTSEDGHFSLFGYNPEKYKIGRGVLEAQALGIKLKKGDVVLRGNFGTVDDNLKMIDRRAGRIKNTGPLIKALSGKRICGIKFLIYPIAEHRIVLILRGQNLSEKISDGDPHYGKMGQYAQKITPLDKNYRAKFTAQVFNQFLSEAQKILTNHPLNKKREKEGLPVANYILTRGAGTIKKIPSFQERYGPRACCIAGKNLYKGIAQLFGMDLIKVKGANGLTSTNLKGKILAAKNALKRYDFVFFAHKSHGYAI